ncbi:MAG: Uma2 family endonuclease [Pseudonocardia sp.]|nr:Uma2 family endonuclease [Pseudonocardia sp.]
MTTVLVGEPPAEIQSWLDRRRALGQDGFDEVWEGVYHVAPMAHGRQGRTAAELAAVLRGPAKAAGLRGSSPINIGTRNDYRVPDWAFLRTSETALWNPTAAIVVEIVSPGDESREKLGFYFAVGVEEVLIVDPLERTVEWFVRGTDAFVAAPGSDLLGITAARLHADIEWPD